MFKKLSLVSAISAILISGSVYSASMTVGFSQIGSESGWRAAKHRYLKRKRLNEELH